jgi:hypothetical protein
MSNMSYCRFRNTFSDLLDCFENMEEGCSEDEARARIRLIKLCQRIVENYIDEETEEPVNDLASESS